MEYQDLNIFKSGRMATWMVATDCNSLKQCIHMRIRVRASALAL